MREIGKTRSHTAGVRTTAFRSGPLLLPSQFHSLFQTVMEEDRALQQVYDTSVPTRDTNGPRQGADIGFPSRVAAVAGRSSSFRPRGRGRGRPWGRPRGITRLRGVSRAHGDGRIDNTAKDPSRGWKIQSSSACSIKIEKDFASNILSEKARLFCSSAMGQLGLELRAKNLEPTRVGHIVLFMGDVLHHCRIWLNEHIALSNVGEEKVSMRDMYRYVSVLLLSHLTGLSFERTIALLTEMNCNVPSLDRTRFISQNIKAF